MQSDKEEHDMEPRIFVLADEHDNLFLIGDEILDQARVRSEEHLKVVRELIGQRDDARTLQKSGDRAGRDLKILGAYEVRQDRFLRLSRLTPNYVILPVGDVPA
jgi:hypothetical protein